MPLFDMPLEELKRYAPQSSAEPDFDAFWERSLAEARSFPLSAEYLPIDAGLASVEAFDASFSGYAGQRIKAWLLLPRARKGKIPCVVEYIGYGGGRGLPHERLLWSAAGYAHFVMDTCGQGSAWCAGDTPDLDTEPAGPQYPGFMTRGILDRERYYYRRVFVDAIRAVDAAKAHAAIDPDRVIVTGGSQGGGIAIAAAALCDLRAAMPDVPFLCDFTRATRIVESHPYAEISSYLKTHRDSVERVYRVLSYFDGMNLAARARCPALFSVALMDETCPPSTVFAAYNRWAGPKEIRVYEFNHHEGGQAFQDREKLAFAARALKG
jgi:cephalosporin-C deacetylase